MQSILALGLRIWNAIHLKRILMMPAKQLPKKELFEFLYLCAIIHVDHHFMETKRTYRSLKRNFLCRELCDNVCILQSANKSRKKYTTFCKRHWTLRTVPEWSRMEMRQLQQKWRYHSQMVYTLYTRHPVSTQKSSKLCVKFLVIISRYWIGIFLSFRFFDVATCQFRLKCLKRRLCVGFTSPSQ